MFLATDFNRHVSFITCISNTLNALFEYINKEHKLVHGSTSHKVFTIECICARAYKLTFARMYVYLRICECLHTFVDIHMNVQTHTLPLSFRYRIRDGALPFFIYMSVDTHTHTIRI